MMKKVMLGMVGMGMVMMLMPVLSVKADSVFCGDGVDCKFGIPGEVKSDLIGIDTETGNVVEAIIKWTNFSLGFVAVLAIAFLIYGGFLNITAGGEDEQASKGRKIIVQAVIGIVIIISAYAIVNTFVGTSTPTAP